MSDILNTLLSIAMIFAPTLGYFDQIRMIVKKKTSLGFNSVTCAILLFSNILRIFFWLGKRFDMTLLFQSIAMITAMLLLLYTVIRYKPIASFNPLTRVDSSSSISFIEDEDIIEVDHQKSSFWAWDHFLDYFNCLLAYTTLIALLYLIFHQYSAFIEALGFLSLGIESTLPVPQILTNLKHKNVDGFSWVILASWFLGDGFKAFYFLYTQSPIQFVVCAILQLSFDTIIVGQFLIYSSPILKKWLGIQDNYESIA
ncbi:hypothetical protein CU097_013233 [Rhizopus azygosporus]|uniref:PQ loop repeat-containing protein 1 n=1 Tax=Rhizopus azygosporus TaxID=86630 RepID=A0A367KB18_RHIAZ|nr:hypothetical protein CU097_013233 [Rhizopus azygosporus]